MDDLTNKNQSLKRIKALIEVPENVSIEMPNLELKVIENNEPFNFSRKLQKRKYNFEIIIGIISIIGVGIGLYFAYMANEIASDNRKQDIMISQLKIMIDTLSEGNKKISETQKNTLKLLNETIQANKNFKNVFSPNLQLVKSGDFIVLGPADGLFQGSMYVKTDYSIQNNGAVSAKNVQINYAYVYLEEGDYDLKYLGSGKVGYHANIEIKPNERMTLVNSPNSSIWDPNSIKKMSRCWMILRIKYYNPIIEKNEESIDYYLHTMEGERYLFEPAYNYFIPKLEKYMLENKEKILF